MSIISIQFLVINKHTELGHYSYFLIVTPTRNVRLSVKLRIKKLIKFFLIKMVCTKDIRLNGAAPSECANLT